MNVCTLGTKNCLTNYDENLKLFLEISKNIRTTFDNIPSDKSNRLQVNYYISVELFQY